MISRWLVESLEETIATQRTCEQVRQRGSDDYGERLRRWLKQWTFKSAMTNRRLMTRLADLRFYAKSLSAEEIQALAAAQ